MPVSSPLLVGLVQITEPMLHLANLPYAVGLLQAYVQQHAPDPRRYLFLLTQFERLPLQQAARQLAQADVVGISLYVWNERYSLALAAAVKALNPRCLIVVGGPQVPDQPAAFLAAQPALDLCVHGEGEQVFLELLEHLPARDWSRLSGVSFRVGEAVVTRPRAPRLRNLENIPSPYLSGTFDTLLLSQPQRRWVAVWETNRGCPFSCTFCDWGSVTQSKVYRFDMARLEAELDWFSAHRLELVFCSDANFGMLPRDLDLAEAAAQRHLRTGYPARLATQAAKNATERVYAVQKRLYESGLQNVVTLSLQSVTPAALQAIRRENISLDTYRELQQRFRRDGIPTYTDVLVGLPGETVESFMQGVATMIAQGQHHEMRQYNVFVLPNAELADPAYRARYAIETVDLPYVPDHTPVGPPPAGIQEIEQMVVATSTMTRADWARMRRYAWISQVVYFSRLLHLPLLLLHLLAGLDFKSLFLAFAEDPLPPKCPNWQAVRSFLAQRTESMLAGGPDYCAGRDPETGRLIWMTTEHFLTQQLLHSPDLGRFYEESARILTALLMRSGKVLASEILTESLALSEAIFASQLPQRQAFCVAASANLWEAYQQGLRGEAPRLVWEPRDYVQTRDAAGQLHFQVRVRPVQPHSGWPIG
ncbi:MAG: B12-binding domain-containing radical SAM protein [Candidatus Sericytochromatia bacterium]